MNKRDILIFMSDQHAGRMLGCAGEASVRTPNIDALAAEGTWFTNAYTACPLCVPARMSFLSGRLPCHTGVFTNKGALHPETPTFLHQLAIAGYETVLCGRMHFEGDDQRHGFTRRIADDITPTAIGPTDNHMEKRGPLAVTMTELGCLHVVGGGNSPALEYDRYVVNAAVDYLSCEHEKPQCIVVGTYAPHFPYIAPEELFDHYYELSELPPTLESANCPVHPAESTRLINSDPAMVRAVRAAYMGMIEFADQCVGEVRKAWDRYLTRSCRNGIFAYLSDHGDHAGDRGFYGKQSLYESSLRIPMLFYGSGISKGHRIDAPVSLLDLAPTICELGGAEDLPAPDGISLANVLNGENAEDGRVIIAEWISNPYFRGTEYGRMIRRDEWKLITYYDQPDQDLLYRPSMDYWETNPLQAAYPGIADELKSYAFAGVDPLHIVREKNIRDEGYDVLARFNHMRGAQNTELWQSTPVAKKLPKEYISSNTPLPPMFQSIWDLRQREDKHDV